MKLGKTLLISLFCSVLSAAGTFYALRSMGSSDSKLVLRDVPGLSGMSLSSARQLAESKDLRLVVFQSQQSSSKSGVLAHIPKAGSQVAKGSVIYAIVASKKAGDPTVRPIKPASKTAPIAPAATKTAPATPSKTVPAKTPLAKTPLAKTLAAKTPRNKAAPTAVSPAKMVEVPRVLGLKLASAKRRVIRAGLKVGRILQKSDEDKRHGTILRQRPRGGKQAASASSVTLWVNNTD
jgi:beta-lactam-binding protein with PASTA domain